jgi:hypothetical protein
MALWIEWYQAVQALRPACTRTRTYLWMLVVLMGLCTRSDLAGVTSFVRVLGLRPVAYHRLLHLFHSTALNLDLLTRCWVRLVLALFHPVMAGPYLVCLADGIKAPKEGRKMPGVKLLHQESTSNSKPSFIMGHSLQAISLLIQGPSGTVSAVPLTSRIHEGVVLCTLNKRTLLDKMVTLMFSVTEGLNRKFLLVADAYYASRKIIIPLLTQGHQLLSRVRSNAVAYFPPPAPSTRRKRKGRPRTYGKKVRLKDLMKETAAFISAPSPVYGEQNVMLRYRCLDLFWRPVGRLVRFVLVVHPHRGCIFLLATDLTLAPLEIIQLYGCRFKIEVGFRQAVHVLGAYAYHFWMSGMTPIRHGAGNQFLHRKSKKYRADVQRKLRAYHVYVQLGCIAQGLLLHLSMNHSATVWLHFRSWLRTMNPKLPPSELIVAHALRADLPGFIADCAGDANMKKMLDEYCLLDAIPVFKQAAA